jgi:hypothetical protein
MAAWSLGNISSLKPPTLSDRHNFVQCSTAYAHTEPVLTAQLPRRKCLATTWPARDFWTRLDHSTCCFFCWPAPSHLQQRIPPVFQTRHRHFPPSELKGFGRKMGPLPFLPFTKRPKGRLHSTGCLPWPIGKISDLLSLPLSCGGQKAFKTCLRNASKALLLPNPLSFANHQLVLYLFCSKRASAPSNKLSALFNELLHS